MTIPAGITVNKPDGDKSAPAGITVTRPNGAADPFGEATKAIIKGANTLVPGMGTALDTARVFTSAVGGEVLAGLAGIPQLLAGDVSGSRATIDAVTNAFKTAPTDDVQGYLGPNPLTPDTGEVLSDLGGIIEPVVKVSEGALGAVLPGVTAKEAYQEGLGDAVFENTGSPIKGTLAGMLFDALSMGTPGVRHVKQLKNLPKKVKGLTSSEKEARKILGDFIEQDQRTLPEVYDRMNGLGPEALIIDVSGANVSEAGRLTGLATREGRELVESNIGSKANRGTLRKPSHANEAADVAYRDLYASGTLRPTQELNNIFGEKLVQDNLKAARDKIAGSQQLSAAEKQAGLKMLREDGGKVYIDTDNVNAVGIDYIKRTLTDKASKLSQNLDASADLADYTILSKRLVDETDKMLSSPPTTQRGLMLSNKPDANVSYSETLGLAQDAAAKRATLNETAKKMTGSDKEVLMLQKAIRGEVNKKKLTEAIGETGTDILFAISQNRFAMLRLIERAGEGKLLWGKAQLSQDVANELGKLLLSDEGAKAFKMMQDEVATIRSYGTNRAINIEKVFQQGPNAAFNWLRSAKARRLLLEEAAIASLLMAKENES